VYYDAIRPLLTWGRSSRRCGVWRARLRRNLVRSPACAEVAGVVDDGLEREVNLLELLAHGSSTDEHAFERGPLGLADSELAKKCCAAQEPPIASLSLKRLPDGSHRGSRTMGRGK
jgi:hypothetical protein